MTNEPISRRSVLGLAALAVAISLGAAACGGDAGDGGDDGDGASEASLPAAAAAGRDLAREKGCAACHGGDGEGGIGPAWTGLAGSTVTLEDGSTVVADEAYLTRAIVDPNAEIVEGYSLQMPANSLSDDEVVQLVAYITALGGDGSTAATVTDS